MLASIRHVLLKQRRRKSSGQNSVIRWKESIRALSSNGDKNVVSSSSSEATVEAAKPPTRQQLSRVFVNNGILMMGFGFMDQTVMIQAGHAIDCSIGATFALSTMAAAAVGHTISDGSGILFGGFLERLAAKAGIEQDPNLNSLQLHLPIVQKTRLAGQVVGIIFGCCLGLANLALIDTDKSSELKLQAEFKSDMEEEQGFIVEASNDHRDDVTALITTGPDVQGLVASMATALARHNCSVVEMHGKPRENNIVQVVIYVVHRDTRLPFREDEFKVLTTALQQSTKQNMIARSLKAARLQMERKRSPF